MDAAIVKFNSLTDSNRAATDGHQALLGSLFHVGEQVDAGQAMGLVGGVVIRGFRCKFSGTGVNHTVNWMQFELMSSKHDCTFVLSWSQ